MDLIEVIETNIRAMGILTEEVQKLTQIISSWVNPDNPPETKPKKRKTKAEKKKEDPCKLDLGEATTDSAKDPLAILDGESSTDEKVITEEMLRSAASALVEVGTKNEQGLKTAKMLITKMGFETLASVTADKYKVLYDAFRLAVQTWKK